MDQRLRIGPQPLKLLQENKDHQSILQVQASTSSTRPVELKESNQETRSGMSSDGKSSEKQRKQIPCMFDFVKNEPKVSVWFSCSHQKKRKNQNGLSYSLPSSLSS